jgi:ketosteroid isomerase-like protein
MPPGNVDVAKAFFDGYNARDSEAVDRLLHPEAQITTLSTRAGMPDHWRQGTTRRYFEQLDEAWTGAGMHSHVEVAHDFATVLVVRNTQIMAVDTYDNWKAGLEAAAERE